MSNTPHQSQSHSPSALRVAADLSRVEFKVASELDNHTLQVNKTKKPFFNGNDLQKEKIDKLKEQKEDISQRLQELTEIERQCEQEIKSIFTRARRQQKTMSRPKSQLTKKQLKKIRQINLKHDQHERELEEKAQRLQKLQYEDIARQQQEKQESMARANQQKKIQIAKRMQELSRKKERRVQKQEEQKKILEKIASQKRLHEQMEQNWLKRQRQEEKRIFKEREQILKDRQFNPRELKDHERKYQDLLKQRKQQMRKRRQQLESFHYTPKNGNSRFYTMAVEETQKSRIQLEEEKILRKEKLLKMIEYGDIVKSSHTPKLRLRTEVTAEQEGESREKRRLKTVVNPEERKEMGINNLHFSKQKARKRPAKEQTSNSINVTLQPSATSKVRYQDYLTETRNTKAEERNQKQKDFSVEIRETKKIMGKSNLNEAEKFEKVKLIAERIQAMSYSANSSVLLKKITAKMKMLNVLRGQ